MYCTGNCVAECVGVVGGTASPGSVSRRSPGLSSGTNPFYTPLPVGTYCLYYTRYRYRYISELDIQDGQIGYFFHKYRYQGSIIPPPSFMYCEHNVHQYRYSHYSRYSRCTYIPETNKKFRTACFSYNVSTYTLEKKETKRLKRLFSGRSNAFLCHFAQFFILCRYSS